MTRTSGSRSSSTQASANSSRIAPFMALSWSGRSLMSQPTGPCRSTSRCWYATSDPPFRPKVGVDPRRGPALLERPPPLHRLLAPQARRHADAVVQAVVGVELPFDVRPSPGGGAATGNEDLGGGVEQLVVRYDARYQTPVDGLLGAERAASEHEVTCPRRAHLPGQDVPVVGVGDAPEQLGDTEGGPLADDRHVAQHGDHQAAALADAVHGADDRLLCLAQ